MDAARMFAPHRLLIQAGAGLTVQELGGRYRILVRGACACSVGDVGGTTDIVPIRSRRVRPVIIAARTVTRDQTWAGVPQCPYASHILVCKASPNLPNHNRLRGPVGDSFE